LLIERKTAAERGSALHAKELCIERRRLGQANTANRNTRDLFEWPLTNAALIGENQRESAIQEFRDEGGQQGELGGFD